MGQFSVLGDRIRNGTDFDAVHRERRLEVHHPDVSDTEDADRERPLLVALTVLRHVRYPPFQTASCPFRASSFSSKKYPAEIYFVNCNIPRLEDESSNDGRTNLPSGRPLVWSGDSAELCNELSLCSSVL
ncbi:hypothetical protein HFX_6209 (plasmid) [Haloferax mediterranei ATCC 33500]|uniref:Uncharacterized protein n=1 Tax=Haloferax mediterranei (strain ATCC 33500 / DSM 1411 / JCM 8866 / NBRC 14739 / NCIMB 2177 / R-4) TaxID=523841 RepID=I3RAS1_HALMT|nr:hypothetical protein HFX_6209 [Haloferax mediterranei ATCC 33500]